MRGGSARDARLPAYVTALEAEIATPRRNFQGYITYPGEATIGLGSTASSQIDDLIIRHVARWHDTVLAGELAGEHGVARTDDNRARTHVIERLLCDDEIDVGNSYPPAIAALPPYADDGQISLDAGAVRLCAEGWLHTRLIAAAVDTHLDRARHSRAV